ncbi:MAG: Dipeptidyl aminopeptidase BIII [Chlamydiae bacterium]|nr:Dipeptidyl aminopeptidase BIII [Chlamydiota bacterium]
MMAIIATFGSWVSPITTDSIVQETISFYEMQADENALYWTELHPNDKGRIALVRYDGKETPLADEVSIRTRVHEYGGGALCIDQGDVIYSNDEDSQLYSLTRGGKLTDEPNMRYADGSGNIWVAEIHDNDVENCLVNIETGEKVASGHDFYSCPRISPDGKRLAYVTWDFPYMQWDSSTLWLAEIHDGKLQNPQAISGGPDESVCQVQWSPSGQLHFVSDKTGFWNLYRYRDGQAENLCEMEAEFTFPPWVFGRPCYTFVSDGSIICMYAVKGIDHLGRINPEKKTLEDLQQPFTAIHNLVTYQDKVYFFGASQTLPNSIICFDPKSNTFEVVKQSSKVAITEEWISKGEVLEYPSMNGKVGYAFYYPPKNPNYKAPEGEKPPLIVKSHGGPTARSYSQFSLEIQYWTSRGFALVDVNYGGSTGYGREYFKRLEGAWGILDVEDCISAAKTLVDKGLADPSKLLIRGGSAGGYTTLAALTFHDVFVAGTSYYGVSDLELLYEDTHKFEAQYTDRLVASYPDGVALIRERSPINHVEKISAPILLLQGEEDKIVPPNQAFKIYDALEEKGTPVGMILFEGEGHGFRQAPNIKRALDAELYFYSKVLGFELAEPFQTPPVEIVGLNP